MPMGVSYPNSGQYTSLEIAFPHGLGQNFTFVMLNERQHLSGEADQTLTSQECHEATFRDLGTLSNLRKFDGITGV